MWHLVPILQCPVDVVYHSSDRKAMGIGVVLFIMISAAKVGGAALSYTITEESPPNTRLGDLMEDTHLRDNLTASDLSGLEFTILAGRSTRYFVIHREGNQHFLQTSDVMIDRDDLCSGQGICLLNLDVAVYVSKAIEDFRVIKIQIFVLDVNDHRPVFPEPQTTLYISENANPGIHFVLPVATDLDAGEYGTISYQLRSNFSEFELFKTASIHGASELHLVLNERVDREKLSEYHMEVVSRDGGEPPLSDVMAVHVIVRDTNDNYPVFLRSIYNVSLKEDQPLQVPFVQVSARDIDEGPNGEIMYDFAPQTKSEHGRMFGINNSNGDIYLKLSLDFELEQVYHLTVKATDQGPDSVPVHCKVIIHVLDVNDFRPQIILNLLSSHQEYAEVMENRSPGVFVAHVSVEDLDLGRSGQASCSITKGNQYFSLESLSAYPNEYKILTTRTLDREAVEEISVMIECVDQGEDPLSSVRELKVKVLDENDNPPRFEQSLYTANLYENVSFPQPVFQVNAIDADSGENANVTYFLSENESGGLQIDPMSGLVSTQVRLDHEAMQTYDGHVYAVDGGLPPNTATAAFKIFIDDINDESPLFSQVTYNFGTFENQAPGTEVGTVVATDADEPPHDLLLYSIHPQEEEASDTFQINPATGKLTILKMLDRESIAFYRFMVLATNTGEPYLSATATVNVHVADQNDNAPTVVFPSPDNNTVVLSVFAYVGYAVAHVQAYDVDAGRNSRLNFSIAKGGDLDLLGITPDTGEVIVKNVLRYVAPPNITLLISIADMGTPPKFAAAELHILFNHTENYAIENGLDSSDQNVFPRYPGPSIVVSSTLPRETLIVIIVGCLSVVLAIGLIVLLILVCRRAPPERKKQESSEIQYSGIQRFAPEDGGDELSVASGSSSHCNRPVRVSPLAVSITMETMCPAGLSPVGEGQAESSLSHLHGKNLEIQGLEKPFNVFQFSNLDSGHGSSTDSNNSEGTDVAVTMPTSGSLLDRSCIDRNHKNSKNLKRKRSSDPRNSSCCNNNINSHVKYSASQQIPQYCLTPDMSVPRRNRTQKPELAPKGQSSEEEEEDSPCSDKLTFIENDISKMDSSGKSNCLQTKHNRRKSCDMESDVDISCSSDEGESYDGHKESLKNQSYDVNAQNEKDTTQHLIGQSMKANGGCVYISNPTILCECGPSTPV